MQQDGPGRNSPQQFGQASPTARVAIFVLFGLGLIVVVLFVLHFSRRPSHSAAAPAASEEIQSGPESDETIRNSDRTRRARQSPARVVLQPMIQPDGVTRPGPPGSENLNISSEQSARTRAQSLVEDMARSGPPSQNLITEASKAFEAWRTSLPETERPELSGFQCFAAGCSTTAAYRSPPSMERKPISQWQGPQFRSGPFQTADGKLRVVFILYRSFQ
jgi:hypothetical protein